MPANYLTLPARPAVAEVESVIAQVAQLIIEDDALDLYDLMVPFSEHGHKSDDAVLDALHEAILRRCPLLAALLASALLRGE